MKNLNRVVGAVLALALYASTSWAQATGAHMAFEPLKFRSHNTSFASQSGSFLDDGFLTTGANNAFDSTFASGIAKFDTTTSISTGGWAMPSRAGSAVDSAVVCRLFIYDAGGSVGLTSVTLGRTSATAESIYVKAQVSVNNSDWFDLAVIAGQSPVLNAWTLQTTTNAGVIAFTTSTNTGLSGKLWSLPYYSAQNAAGLRNGLDISHVGEFPYVRWIISGSRTLNHAFKAMVGYPTTNSSKFPG